jgi:hypothetical protein
MFVECCQESGIWPIIMISACVMNADHAPWDDAKWYSAGRVAVESYLSISDPNFCPVFAELGPRILADMGEGGFVAEEALQRAWASLSDAWQHKAPKVGLRVWFHFVRAMRVFLKIWHSRLLVVWFMCLTQGMLKRGPSDLRLALAAGQNKEDHRRNCRVLGTPRICFSLRCPLFC